MKIASFLNEFLLIRESCFIRISFLYLNGGGEMNINVFQKLPMRGLSTDHVFSPPSDNPHRQAGQAEDGVILGSPPTQLWSSTKNWVHINSELIRLVFVHKVIMRQYNYVRH